MRTALQLSWRASATLALTFFLLLLVLRCGATSLQWLDAPFPGFFVLANRVVASVALPHWSISAESQRLYQSEVLAVNNAPVSTAEDLLTLVRRQPVGTPIVYTFKKDERIFQLALPSQLFTHENYVLIFAAYAFTALTIAGTSLVVWFLKPRDAASRALLVAGLVTGVFGVTALDLYWPYQFFRLHVLAEAFLPAPYIHLGFVFPVDRLRRSRAVSLALPYVLSGALAIAYEWFLYTPAAYSLIHNLCMVYVGVAAPIFLGRFVWDYATADSPLVRQRIRVMIVGFLSGYGVPTMLMFFSGITGGAVAVNYMAFSAFLFPVSIGYAIVKHNLFEIDAFLKRWLSYLILTTALTVTYFALLALLNVTLASSWFAHSLVFPLLFTLGVAFFLHPMKEVLQRGIDRIFFRLRYNPKKVLEKTSAFLASTLQLEDILAFIWRTITVTVGVRSARIVLLSPETKQYLPVYPHESQSENQGALPPSLLERLQRDGRVLSLYDVLDGVSLSEQRTRNRAELERLGAQLFVPLLFKDALLGVLTLDQKNDGGFFSAEDVLFLSTLANQAALSIANALAYQEIQQLNSDLEKRVEQVREKEQEVERSHTQLRRLSARLLHLQEEERERISRELHDHLGQVLTATIMDIRWAQNHCPKELAPIRERLQEAAYLVQVATRTTRELSVSLRPEIVNENGLEVALKQSVVEFERRSGLPVRFHCRLEQPDIPSPIAMNVYRIVQEALSNIARHAAAKQVDIQVKGCHRLLTASITDDGVGFNGSTLSDPHALGLVGMQERARLLGGQLEIRSTPGVGVSVWLQVPLREKEKEDADDYGLHRG